MRNISRRCAPGTKLLNFDTLFQQFSSLRLHFLVSSICYFCLLSFFSYYHQTLFNYLSLGLVGFQFSHFDYTTHNFAVESHQFVLCSRSMRTFIIRIVSYLFWVHFEIRKNKLYDYKVNCKFATHSFLYLNIRNEQVHIVFFYFFIVSFKYI